MKVIVFSVSGSNAEGNVYAQERKNMLNSKKKELKVKYQFVDKGEYKGPDIEIG